MSAIEIADVRKQFGSTQVLNGVTLSVPDGSMTAILGASGSGKTTLLRLLAGFERVDAGTIRFGGKVVDDGRATVRAQDRGVGFVPQDAALFPHLSALKNVAFGLGRAERDIALELLDMVGLASHRDRYPHQLSGGQQQRVALARALAIRPRLVLLDEPFSSLDAALRGELRRDVARVLAETGTTTLLVTHDQDEALGLADRVALLCEGEIVACDAPSQLYEDPPALRAAMLLGEANVLGGQAEHAATVHCALGSVPMRKLGQGVPDGPCRVLLRPEQLVLHPHERFGATHASVQELTYHGHDTMAKLHVAGHDEPLLARVPGEQRLWPGQDVWVEVSGLARAWPETP